MANLGSDPDILGHVLSGFIGWWDSGGMPMTAGAGLAGIGALAMAAAQSLKTARPAKAVQPSSRRARIEFLTTVYAEPLASAAVDLLWRCKEIVGDRSGHYLAPNTPGGAYFTYKRQSTAYRLAALLGWMRAIDREVNVLGSAQREARAGLLAALEHISAALADGPALEFSRAARLCDVWGLPRFAADDEAGDGAVSQQLAYDSIAFDGALRKHLPGVEADDAHALIAALMKFSREDLLDLFRKLAFDLARIRGVEPPSPNRVLESIEETARALAYREAHIYREWQRAIGDVMLRAGETDEGALQMARVLSFSEFEAQIASTHARSTPWMRRLTDLFEGVEIDSAGEHDSRPRQLRRLTEATAGLVLALTRLPRARNMITKETLLLARALAPQPPR